MASMLETTASQAMRSPPPARTATTAPFSTSNPVTSTPVRSSAPRSAASFANPSATARVPPFGYHTPSEACMSPMEQSTAGAR